MNWSKYNYEYQSPRFGRLLFNYLTGAFVDINDSEIQSLLQDTKNDPNVLTNINQELVDYLYRNGFVCDDDTSNEDILLYKHEKMKHQHVHKTLVIVPTLDCNLRCPYCYQGDNKPHISMNGTVKASVKQYLSDNVTPQNTSTLALLWFGGEPLLEFDTMCEITNYVKELGVPFVSDIITNGILLTQEKIDRFEDLNVKQLQITFDGNKDSHDRKRIFHDGRGTFDLLLERCHSLNAYAQEHPELIVYIRVNVDPGNKDKCVELLRTLETSFPFLRRYVAPLKQYHACSSAVDCFSGDTEVLNFMISLYNEYGIDVIDYKSIMKGIRPCMAECESSVIIGPSGETYLCLNDVGDPKETTGSIVTGDYNYSLISKYRTGRLTTFNESCKNCKAFWICGGGCPNSQYRNKFYGERNEVCTPLKRNEILNKYLDARYEIWQSFQQ